MEHVELLKQAADALDTMRREYERAWRSGAHAWAPDWMPHKHAGEVAASIRASLATAPVAAPQQMGEETNALYGLLYRIREAVGDPKGRLMQDELVEHIRALAAAPKEAPPADHIADANEMVPQPDHVHEAVSTPQAPTAVSRGDALPLDEAAPTGQERRL